MDDRTQASRPSSSPQSGSPGPYRPPRSIARIQRCAAFLESRLRPALHNRCQGRAFIGEKVFIGPGTVVEDGVMIKGPAIIGKNCRIRHNAYLREHVIIGDDCVVGNSTEVKNSLFFNHAQAPHFNYVGDSILGHKAHLRRRHPFQFQIAPRKHHGGSGRRALRYRPAQIRRLLGDLCEIGCNSVLGPGSIIGRAALLYPSLVWRGFLPANMIVKNRAHAGSGDQARARIVSPPS